MGINLGNMNSGSTGATNIGGGIVLPAPTPVAENQTVSDGKGGLTLNLQKNQVLDITKRNPGLKKIKVGLGWDASRSSDDSDLDVATFILDRTDTSKICYYHNSFDLDVVALILDSRNKITDTSKICYYHNRNTNGCNLSEDNRTGQGEGDDETITVDLANVPKDVEKIVFAVTIYEADVRRQNFGMIDNSYIRLLDNNNGDKELCRFILTDNSSFDKAVLFAEVYRNGQEWEFRTIGEGKNVDLNGLANLYF